MLESERGDVNGDVLESGKGDVVQRNIKEEQTATVLLHLTRLSV